VLKAGREPHSQKQRERTAVPKVERENCGAKGRERTAALKGSMMDARRT
jgi:hypothetical protein